MQLLYCSLSHTELSKPQGMKGRDNSCRYDVPEKAKRDWNMLREAFMNALESLCEIWRLKARESRKIDFYMEWITSGFINVKHVC